MRSWDGTVTEISAKWRNFCLVCISNRLCKSKITKESRNIKYQIESCDSTFELELLTTDELRNLVNDIPLGKADGLDGIPISLLKLSFKFIASSITHIFNLVISTGIISNDWKSTRITPIYKADSKVDPANYRPISVLSVIGKLFEKAIFNQVYAYLFENNLQSWIFHI